MSVMGIGWNEYQNYGGTGSKGIGQRKNGQEISEKPQRENRQEVSKRFQRKNLAWDRAVDKSGQKTGKTHAGPYIVYMMDEDMLYSGGNGTGLSFYIKWVEDSTEENPIMVAKGVDENGEEFEQRIRINDINPTNATLVEMRALEAYTGVDKNGGLSSLPMGTGDMGLSDRRNFMQMFKKEISDMTLLKQRAAVAYYEYSMQNYWDFLDGKKGEWYKNYRN